MAGKDASGSVPYLSENRRNRRPHRFAALTGAACLLFAATAIAADASRRPATNPATSDPQAAVMAVVNGEQISRHDLGQECLRRYGGEVLDSMIHKQIIHQACQSRGVQITNQQIEEEIQRVAGRFGLDVNRWLELLETERDVNPQQYRKDIIWPTLALRRLAAQEIEITPAEYQQAFESEYGAKVKARLIAVSSREKAEQLLQRVRANPEQFGQLAKEHSEDRATASAYGVIPPIRKHVGDPSVEQAAFALEEGEISPLLKVGNQYILLKCERKIPRVYISSQQLPDIEQQLKERIREHKLRLQAADVFQQLESQSQVVRIFGDAGLQKQHPGVAAIVNSQPVSIQQVAEECVARYGRDVLEGEINRRLLLQELRRRNETIEDPDIRREVARAADAYGYLKTDGSPDIDAWLKAVTEDDATTIELYIRDAVWPSAALKKLVGEDVEVTAEDLQKGFQSNFGERVEALAIVLSNHRQAQTVWEMARNNPTDQFFGELAHQYSIEPSSRANFGKVPPLRQHSGQPLLEKEAFKLEAGELSGIIAVGDKYIILRCLGRTEPIVRDFDAVKDELSKDILEKKLRLAMAKEFDRLKETAQIDNFLAGTSQSGRLLGTHTASPASYNQQPGEGGAAISR